MSFDLCCDTTFSSGLTTVRYRTSILYLCATTGRNLLLLLRILKIISIPRLFNTISEDKYRNVWRIYHYIIIKHKEYFRLLQ